MQGQLAGGLKDRGKLLCNGKQMDLQAPLHDYCMQLILYSLPI